VAAGRDDCAVLELCATIERVASQRVVHGGSDCREGRAIVVDGVTDMKETPGDS